MGNSVSAHIYETKVFRPYPVILYRLRLDPLSGKKSERHLRQLCLYDGQIPI